MPKLAVFTAAFLLLALATSASAEVVPLDKVPGEVLKAVKKRFPAAEIKQATKVVEDDETTYEIELTYKGKQIDLVLTPAGEITEIAVEIAETAIPKEVTKAIEAKYPKSSIEDASVVFNVAKGKETLSHFEIEIETADERALILEITRAGAIRKETRKGKK